MVNEDYKVIIEKNEDEMVVIQNTPTITENHAVNYNTVDATHMPGSPMAYNKTPNTTYSVSSEFVSTNIEEATYHSQCLRFLRSWKYPFFGKSANAGAPPPILIFSAYSDHYMIAKEYGTAHIHRVPVVIKALTVEYPQDTDFIPNEEGEPVPIIMTVNITLEVAHAPKELQSMNVADIKEGRLLGF